MNFFVGDLLQLTNKTNVCVWDNNLNASRFFKIKNDELAILTKIDGLCCELILENGFFCWSFSHWLENTVMKIETL